MARIVIFEDDEFLAQTWSLGLRMHGHEATITTSSDKVLQMVDERQVDLLIADIFIRHEGKILSEGGISLLSRLRVRSNASHVQVPTIVVSGAMSKDILQIAGSIGNAVTLSKPVDLHKLIDTVDSLLHDAAENSGI